MKRFGKGAAAPPPPVPSDNVTMPNAAPAPVPNMKPVDVPVDKLPAPVAVAPPPPDGQVVHTAPESPENATGEQKGASKFNKFLKKPGGGRRFLKGFRRGEDKPATDNADVAVLPDGNPLPDPAVAEKKNIKAERHAAQVAEYEERLSEWNADLRRKKNENELMDLPFDPDTEMRPKPTPPAPLVESDDETAPVEEATSAPSDGNVINIQKRVSSFRPIDTPVVVEGQEASQIAEMFASKAYGAPSMHPAAAMPNNVSMASMFSVAGPILPPGPSMEMQQQQHGMQQHAGPQPGMTAPFAQQPAHAYHQQAPPPAAGYQQGYQQHAHPAAFTPHMPQAQYAPPMGAPGAHIAERGMQMPQAQSNTYVDPGLAEQIRRGREMTKLGIRSEESGNMGSAKEAYMKALELLIPAIPLLDHGNDVSYTFRMNEKRKLNREAGLMLDRCEEIKKFLESEVAALNTRNLLESAPVPRFIPKQPSVVRQEFFPEETDTETPDASFDNGEREGGSGDVGLAKRPVLKKKTQMEPPAVQKLNVPKAPPPPPSNLLDGFSSMGLGESMGQANEMAPGPAPLPAPLPKSTLHRKSGCIDDTRQQAMSRPPMGGNAGGIPPSPPAFPETPPYLHQNQNRKNGPQS